MVQIISRICALSLRTCCNHCRIGTILQKTSTSNNVLTNSFSSTHSNSHAIKVTILGAGGNLGKTVSMILKQSPLIDELCLFDPKPVEGFVTDLNYLDTKCLVTSFSGYKNIGSALTRSSVVVILASNMQTTSANYDSLFEKSTTPVREYAVKIAKFAPRSFIAIGTEPINSVVPMFSEIMKKQGHYNPNAIFGITTIDVVRANKFVAEVMGIDPECVVVPVIGGHTERTMVPILSQAAPCNNFTNEELEDITTSVRRANDNLARVRTCEGAYLSNAFAVSRFVISLVKGIRGQNDVVECAYVRSSAHPQLKYMVTPLALGPGGIAKNLGVPDVSDYEHCLLENAIPVLIEDIKKGECIGAQKCGEKPVCDPCDPRPNAPRCPPDHCELQSLIARDKN